MYLIDFLYKSCNYRRIKKDPPYFTPEKGDVTISLLEFSLSACFTCREILSYWHVRDGLEKLKIRSRGLTEYEILPK